MAPFRKAGHRRKCIWEERSVNGSTWSFLFPYDIQVAEACALELEVIWASTVWMWELSALEWWLWWRWHKKGPRMSRGDLRRESWATLSYNQWVALEEPRPGRRLLPRAARKTKGGYVRDVEEEDISVRRQWATVWRKHSKAAIQGVHGEPWGKYFWGLRRIAPGWQVNRENR